VGYSKPCLVERWCERQVIWVFSRGLSVRQLQQGLQVRNAILNLKFFFEQLSGEEDCVIAKIDAIFPVCPMSYLKMRDL
jgi:hypothetical protein